MVKNTVQKRLLLSTEKIYVCFLILLTCANIFLSFEQKYMFVENIHIQTRTHIYLVSRTTYSIWFWKIGQTTVKEKGVV